MSDTEEKLLSAVERAELLACDCDRMDKLDDPHRHERDMACVYWAVGKPDEKAVIAYLETLGERGLRRMDEPKIVRTIRLDAERPDDENLVCHRLTWLLYPMNRELWDEVTLTQAELRTLMNSHNGMLSRMPGDNYG